VVEALDRDHLRHAGRRHHPELVKVFTSTKSGHVKEVLYLPVKESFPEHPVRVDCRQLQRLLARLAIAILMLIAATVSTFGLSALMIAPAVFAFGLVAFGFLGMDP